MYVLPLVLFHRMCVLSTTQLAIQSCSKYLQAGWFCALGFPVFQVKCKALQGGFQDILFQWGNDQYPEPVCGYSLQHISACCFISCPSLQDLDKWLNVEPNVGIQFQLEGQPRQNKPEAQLAGQRSPAVTSSFKPIFACPYSKRLKLINFLFSWCFYV